jgi:hypothetical protein
MGAIAEHVGSRGRRPGSLSRPLDLGGNRTGSSSSPNHTDETETKPSTGLRREHVTVRYAPSAMHWVGGGPQTRANDPIRAHTLRQWLSTEPLKSRTARCFLSLCPVPGHYAVAAQGNAELARADSAQSRGARRLHHIREGSSARETRAGRMGTFEQGGLSSDVRKARSPETQTNEAGARDELASLSFSLSAMPTSFRGYAVEHAWYITKPPLACPKLPAGQAGDAITPAYQHAQHATWKENTRSTRFDAN